MTMTATITVILYFSLSGTNDSGTNTSMFPIELFGIKTNPAKSAQNLDIVGPG